MLARLNHPLIIGGMAAVIAVITAATAYRTWLDYAPPSVDFDWNQRGMSDFHNATYLPSLAFREGANPYAEEVADRYLISRQTPAYSPVLFLLHLPVTWLPLPAADIVCFAFYWVLLAMLAWCGIRMSGRSVNLHVWLLLIIMVLLSRPGQNCLYAGYFTVELVVGTVLALHFARSRPAVAGFGMMLASFKPTYVIPLMVLMTFRRDFRAVAWGIVFCGVGGMLGWWWLARESGFVEVLQCVWLAQAAHVDNVYEFPVNTWTRVDLLGMASKIMNWNPRSVVNLAAMFVVLAIPGWVLWRSASRTANPGATGLSAFIIVLSMLLGIYSHAYDCLLLVVPWIGAAFYGRQTLPELRDRERLAVVLLTAVPAANYLSTLSARSLLGLEASGLAWQFITLINGLCLLVALLILLVHALRLQSHSPANGLPCEGS
jgi:hypothetical protein